MRSVPHAPDTLAGLLSTGGNADVLSAIQLKE